MAAPHLPYHFYLYGLRGALNQTDWLSATPSDYQWMLLDDTYVPNATDYFVSDVVAFELTDGSYARIDVGVRTLGGNSNLAEEITNGWFSQNPTFGALVGGESTGWCVLFRNYGADATSQLIVALKINKVTDGSSFEVYLAAGRGSIGGGGAVIVTGVAGLSSRMVF